MSIIIDNEGVNVLVITYIQIEGCKLFGIFNRVNKNIYRVIKILL
jgi:hypothetical protein